MDAKEIRKRLKKSQPSLIRQYLIPELWFKEDGNETEYWVFYYAFYNRFSDKMISDRIGYYKDRHIYNISLQIIENNLLLISNFLRDYC